MLQLFADKVAQASQDAEDHVRQRAARADLDGEQETIRDVQQGRAALGATGARALDSAEIDDFQALVAPFLISSYAQQQQVLQSDVAKRMLASPERIKLTGVAVLPGPMRRMLGVKKSYLAVSDFAGTRIGLNRSKLGAATLHALGATRVTRRFRRSCRARRLETSYDTSPATHRPDLALRHGEHRPVATSDRHLRQPARLAPALLNATAGAA